MNTLYIPLHSFIDVVTNSSSEIFVFANTQTLNTIEKLVTDILKLGGSSQKATDLFEFDLVFDTYEAKIPLDSEAGKLFEKEHQYDEVPTRIMLRVRTLDTSNAASIQIAAVLSNLTKLFNIESIQA